MNTTLEHKSQTANQRAQQHESQSAKAYPSRTIVHAKLEMTEPGDHDEQEADAVANTIMSGAKIARKISGGGGSSGIAVSTQMESQLSQLQGGGRQMPEGLRNMMESGFGQDFSQVRLHTDSEAASLSSSIHAKAFTHGNDIYFNQGQFSPETSEGQHLVAHELTHVVQGTGKVGREEDSSDEMTLNQRIKTGKILPNDDIKKLKTRKQRAEYLFTPDMDQPNRGQYLYDGLDVVEAAFAGKRIYGKKDNASADMVKLKVDVIGDDGKVFLIELSVHYKLANYVQAMFDEIKKAYSFTDPSDNFVFDETDKARGAFVWRYPRFDKTEHNEEIRDKIKEEIQNLELDDETLSIAKDIASRKGNDNKAKIRNFLYSEETYAIYEQFLKLTNMSEDSVADQDREKVLYDFKNLVLKDEGLLENAQKSTKKKFFNTLVNKYSQNKSLNDAISKYTSILKHEKDEASLEQENKKYDNIIALLKKKETIFKILKFKKIEGLKEEIQNLELDDETLSIAKDIASRKGNDNKAKTRNFLHSEETYAIYEQFLKLTNMSEDSVADQDREKVLYDFKNLVLKDEGLLENAQKSTKKKFFNTLVNKYSQNKSLNDAISKYTSILKHEKDMENIVQEDITYDDINEQLDDINKQLNDLGIKNNIPKRKKSLKDLDLDTLDKEITKINGTIKTNNSKKPDYKATLFSEHSAGVAIDINPSHNERYDGPAKPNEFIGTKDDRFTIKDKSKIVEIFKEYGWRWGGEWSEGRDYMHFEWFSKTWPK